MIAPPHQCQCAAFLERFARTFAVREPCADAYNLMQKMSSKRPTASVLPNPRVLPTGTPTFLFSDIEGSTARWERAPERMSDVLKRHDEILEAAVTRNGGHVFKKIGDAVCAAFARPSSAIASAIDGQRALARADFGDLGALHVRMALHTGEAEERDGDYYGPALNRVARLLSAAYGQQILVSSTTAELLTADRSTDAGVRSLGIYRLRDLVTSEEIFQLCAPGLREDFPRLRALDSPPSNLPSRITTLVGRDHDIVQLKERLKQTRLLTLAGSGGVGKTRLAIELGESVLLDYPDGVWIVEFAAISEPQLIPSAIASALSLRSTPDSGNASGLSALAPKRLLLILDNCEHLIDAIAHVVDQVLKTCPNVRCVATSREPLGIVGESVQRVGSLRVPSSTQGEVARQDECCSALHLFCQRAQQAREDFSLTEENASLVADICRRLDGLPLAIELVAAQLRVLTLEELLGRLQQRLDLPVPANRAALPRHITIDSLIGWSYGLLKTDEQLLFRQLSIFSGTFSLEAACNICSVSSSAKENTAMLLSRLVDQSLLFVDAHSGARRYRLLQTTRQYALEKLRASGEFAATAHRQAIFFQAFVAFADTEFHHTPQEVWLGRLTSELDNIRSVLTWTLTKDGLVDLGAEIVGRLDRFWFERGLLEEARGWIDRALRLLPQSEHLAEQARLWLARSLFLVGEEKFQAAQRSCTLYESVDDKRGIALALREIGIALRQLGRMQGAREALGKAVSLLGEQSDAGALALALNALGALHAYTNDFARAGEIYSQSLTVARNSGAEYALLMGYLHLADLHFSSGDCRAAVDCALQAVPLAQAAMDSRFYANLKYNLAAYRIGLRDLDAAREDAEEALEIIRANHDTFQMCNVVLHIAFLAASSGQTEKAVKLVGYSDRYLSAHGVEREPTEQWVRDETLHLLEQKLPPQALTAGLAKGATIGEDEAFQLALLL